MGDSTQKVFENGKEISNKIKDIGDKVKNSVHDVGERMKEAGHSIFDSGENKWCRPRETDLNSFGWIDKLMSKKHAYDLRVLKDSYVLHVDCPGIPKTDLHVKTHQEGNTHYLSVSGQHVSCSTDKQWCTRRQVHELVQIPWDVKVDHIEAELRDGVLAVILPRGEVEQIKGKEIEVHEGELGWMRRVMQKLGGA